MGPNLEFQLFALRIQRANDGSSNNFAKISRKTKYCAGQKTLNFGAQYAHH
jgi:hypothetical protein